MEEFRDLYEEWSRKERFYAISFLIFVLGLIIYSAFFSCSQRVVNSTIKCTTTTGSFYLLISISAFLGVFYGGEIVENIIYRFQELLSSLIDSLNEISFKSSSEKSQVDEFEYSYREN